MIMKMMVITESMTLNLPSDWDSSDNTLWLFAPGGRGMNDAGAPFPTGGGGGGGGGFQELTNVVSNPGDLWTIKVGLKNTGGSGVGPYDPAGASWIKGPDLNYLNDGSNDAYADAGNNAASQVGGLGGSGLSEASSPNRGNASGISSGGGGGGSGAGPHDAKGTRGGAGSNKGGGGGGGSGGDYTDPDESLATSGATSASTTGASGGPGYYGTGAGTGSAGAGASGTSNTGGGAAGGGGNATLSNLGTDGGNGASWDYILTLPVGEWISPLPFTWTTTLSGRYVELSNGTVPGGGGGAGGGAFGGNGGDGGFPGGGGGGASDSFGNVAVGGSGADGLILLFYEGSESPVVGVRASVRWI